MGTLVACMLPFALGFMALWALRQQSGDEALGELLVHELITEALLLEESRTPVSTSLLPGHGAK